MTHMHLKSFSLVSSRAVGMLLKLAPHKGHDVGRFGRIKLARSAYMVSFIKSYIRVYIPISWMLLSWKVREGE